MTLLAGTLAGSAWAEEPTARPRRDTAVERPTRRLAPDGTRKPRRPLEQPPPPSEAERAARAKTLAIDARDGFSCRGRAFKLLRQQLLTLTNTDPLMSLELWGDAHAYTPLQRVIFYVRSPRASYVTLYWLGPQDHVIVPVHNVRIPAHRDVAIDSGGYIVPPLGREQWVAVATLQPLPGACGSEGDMVMALARAISRPHAVGRWEVTSQTGAAPKTKKPRLPTK